MAKLNIVLHHTTLYYAILRSFHYKVSLFAVKTQGLLLKLNRIVDVMVIIVEDRVWSTVG